jgi:hypothetical protein
VAYLLRRNVGDLEKKWGVGRDVFFMDREKCCSTGRGTIKVLKELVQKGVTTRLVVKSNEEKVFINVPLIIVIICGVLAPVIVGLAFVLCLTKNCKIEFLK